jgi:hypothetical protein
VGRNRAKSTGFSPSKAVLVPEAHWTTIIQYQQHPRGGLPIIDFGEKEQSLIGR